LFTFSLIVGILAITSTSLTISLVKLVAQDFSLYQHFGDNLAGVMILAFVSVFSLWCIAMSGLAARNAATLKVVHPISNLAARLPLNEVLVRSSEQPNAGPSELLRPELAEAARGYEDLMRASSRVQDESEIAIKAS
jgi:hypothetical protein